MEIGAEFSDAFLGSGTELILRIQEHDDDAENQRLIQAGRLRMIPPITSQDLYLWMVEFSATVPDRALCVRLEEALDGLGAVWRFRNVLYHVPEWFDRWEDFKNARLLAAAADWLDSVS